ncbi:hypothetical protein HNQ77_005333 [Silvibacterium bohemicum]|uniref:Uncharacterized protein n=1 Tax=Silvibacterium bohemicum TaxID=1577686 RepID=A0A841K446_9BACT|nr:hypothetical protein [Silvibacterium bohemicum]MBB6147337.1 hypothetical protein [Silvibacterium bohemicum]
MSRLKLQHGVSRIRRAKLQSSIDQTVADDIELMAKWSNNETHYIINELLRFAIAQEEDFLKYKASLPANATQTASDTKPGPSPIKPASATATKPDVPVSSTAAHA